MTFNFYLPLFLSLIIFPSCQAPVESERQTAISAGGMLAEFKDPPASTKPWIYWYWINDHVSAEGITRDLRAMADVGIGAALIGNIYLDRVTKPDGQVPMLSEEWKRMVQHAIREGDRLGVDIGLFNSPGWSQSGGPWNTTENSMRFLASRETRVTGPAVYSQLLPAPEGDFQDVAVLAFPTPLTTAPIQLFDQVLTGKKNAVLPFHASPPSTGSTAVRPAAGSYSSITLTPTGTFVANGVLSAKVDGGWKTVREFRLDRSNDMDQIGFYDNPPLTLAFPATEASEFKLNLTDIRPTRSSRVIGISKAEIEGARLEYGLEKQLALMHQTPLPLADAYRWPEQEEPMAREIVASTAVINISEYLSAGGVLNWEVPPGEWIIVRTGMLPTGVKNGPSSPQASGPEVDKINRGALPQHFDAFVGDILRSMPAQERKAFKYVVADSYEMGGQNWTDNFASAFREAYDYDPIPWLPVLGGRVVGSVDESNRFLWDLRRLVADRVAYEYVGGLRELCEQHGLKLWLENYGHWGFPSEFLLYGGQSDYVGGEFWNEGSLGSVECKAAASAAHIYGKNQVSAESFTAAGGDFERHPAMLKKRGDWSFTEGINHRVYHVYIQQAYEEKQPGVNAPFGTEFNRHNLWFPKAKAWVDYERRCGYLLRQGQFVADIAYFIGEDAPKMTGVANPSPPPGYAYDYINADVLHHRTTVVDGRLQVRGGPSYQVLVLPASETMRPEMLRRIAELVAAGLTVVGVPPDHSPSLENFGIADGRVRDLASALWNSESVTADTNLQRVLLQTGTPADVELPQGTPVLWIHRRAPGREIYFLTNQGRDSLDFVAGFRAKGMRPEWWDPISGAHRPLPEFRAAAEHVHVPLRLGPLESGFVVFTDADGPAPTGTNYSETIEVTALTGPWSVHFENDFLGVDTVVKMEGLTDWSLNDDESIRYFSGSATYRKSFPAPDVQGLREVWLELGEAAVIANITLNGQVVGGLWTDPWKIEVSDYLRPGLNDLEIEVTNLWVNQLVKDKNLPEARQKLWTLTGVRPKTDELSPSGLLGPVRLTSPK